MSTFLDRILLPPGQGRAGRVWRALTRVTGALLMGLVLVMHRSWPVDFRVLAGTAAMSLAAGLFLQFHLRHTSLRAAKALVAERATWATALLAAIGVQTAQLALEAQGPSRSGQLLTAPLVAQAMLVSALFGPSIGLVALTITALLLSFSGAMTPELTAIGWVAGAVGAHVVNPMKQRGDLFKALGVQMSAQALLACCMLAVTTDSVRTVAEGAAWAALSGLLAVSVFWLGIALLERIFGLVSDWGLLELCSPEHPLLKDLCLRAPGTHVHSMGVANLAENAAREIGANSVLSRAMAYFHDVGKLTRPGYFAENLGEDNPHDDLSPTVSAQIIVSHVRDGAALAREHKVPQIVIDGIEQHHGTSLVSFFYSKALTQGVAPDDEKLAGFFRYEGPKPQNRETAILHLADQVEAACRALRRDENIADVVHKIIEASRADGQLDESDLTFRDLRLIESSFISSLQALRHERIVYPETGTPDGESHSPERIGNGYKA